MEAEQEGKLAEASSEALRWASKPEEMSRSKLKAAPAKMGIPPPMTSSSPAATVPSPPRILPKVDFEDEEVISSHRIHVNSTWKSAMFLGWGLAAVRNDNELIWAIPIQAKGGLKFQQLTLT